MATINTYADSTLIADLDVLLNADFAALNAVATDTLLGTAGDILIRSTTAPVALGIGTTGQVLTVSATGFPEWTSTAGVTVTRYWTSRISDAQTTPTSATYVDTLVPIPVGLTLTSARVDVDTAGTTGTMTVDILKNGVTILSSTLDLAVGVSTNSVVPNVTAYTAFDTLSVVVGGASDAKGLRVTLTGTE